MTVATYVTLTQAGSNGISGLAVNPGASTFRLYAANMAANTPSVTIIPLA